MTFSAFFFLISNLTLPWHNLKAASSHLFTWDIAEQTDPHLTTASFCISWFWNESSAGPQINPSKPPQTPTVAGWDSKPCIFLSLQQQDPCFLIMSSAVCRGQSNQSSRQLRARLLPPSAASTEETFHLIAQFSPPPEHFRLCNKTSPEQTASTSTLIKTGQAGFARPQTFHFHLLI